MKAAEQGDAAPLVKKLEEMNEFTAPPEIISELYAMGGSLLAESGDLVAAEALLTEAIRRAPQFESALIERGVVRMGLDHVDDALADFSKVIELGTRRIMPFILSGNTYYWRHQTVQSSSIHRR